MLKSNYRKSLRYSSSECYFKIWLRIILFIFLTIKDMVNNILEYYYPLAFPSIKKKKKTNSQENVLFQIFTVVLPLKDGGGGGGIQIMLVHLVYFHIIMQHLKQKNQSAFVKGDFSRGNPGRIFFFDFSIFRST